jgi:translation elongation factor EF-1alpha
MLRVDKIIDSISAAFIPICATTGDNYTELSSKSPWYARRFGESNGEIPEQGTLVQIIDEVHRS